jgi:hypothetical protein
VFSHSQSLRIIHEKPLRTRPLLFGQICLVVGNALWRGCIYVFESVGVVEVILGSQKHLNWLKINSYGIYVLVTAQRIIVRLILGQILKFPSLLN